MDNYSKDNDFANKSQGFVDSAADKLQGGIRSANQGSNAAAYAASSKIESLRTGAGEAIDQVSDQAQATLDKLSGVARKARDLASDTQDSILTYTREQPVKALLIAAAAGAILVTLVRALAPSTDD